MGPKVWNEDSRPLYAEGTDSWVPAVWRGQLREGAGLLDKGEEGAGARMPEFSRENETEGQASGPPAPHRGKAAGDP